ncbi:hypothetical protein ACVWWW_001688 [Lysobacter sp. HA18]
MDTRGWGEPGDRGELGDGQLLALEQREQADAGGVGEGLELARPGFEVHASIYQRIAIER